MYPSQTVRNPAHEAWLLSCSVLCFLRPHHFMMASLISAESDAEATGADNVVRAFEMRRSWEELRSKSNESRGSCQLTIMTTEPI